jgi:hypothetical protein
MHVRGIFLTEEEIEQYLDSYASAFLSFADKTKMPSAAAGFCSRPDPKSGVSCAQEQKRARGVRLREAPRRDDLIYSTHNGKT